MSGFTDMLSRHFLTSALVFMIMVLCAPKAQAQFVDCKALEEATLLAAKGIDHMIDSVAGKPSLSCTQFVTGKIDPKSLHPSKIQLEGFIESYVYYVPGNALHVSYRGSFEKDEVAGKMLSLEFQLTDCWKEKGWLKRVEKDDEHKHFYILDTGDGKEVVAELLVYEVKDISHMVLLFVEETHE